MTNTGTAHRLLESSRFANHQYEFVSGTVTTVGATTCIMMTLVAAAIRRVSTKCAGLDFISNRLIAIWQSTPRKTYLKMAKGFPKQNRGGHSASENGE